MEVLQSQINPASATFKSNMAHNLEQVRLLRDHTDPGGHERASAVSSASGGSGLRSGAAPLAGLDELGDFGGLDVALAGPRRAG